MLRIAGSWSTITRSSAPSGSASSASLVRTKVNGQTSPLRSIPRGLFAPASPAEPVGSPPPDSLCSLINPRRPSAALPPGGKPRSSTTGGSSPAGSPAGSPCDDEVGGEAEGDDLVMIEWTQRAGRGVRRAALREPDGVEIHHPVAVGHRLRDAVGPHQVQHGPHVQTSTRSARARAAASSLPTGLATV